MELPNLPKVKNKECNTSRETLSGDEDEIRRQIRYVQEIGVYHEI
jgi:hypothetical protein